MTLALVWSSDFTEEIQKLLSSVENMKRQDVDEKAGLAKDAADEKKDITIDDCFDEFKKPEILDENNKWYCNKCKEHV